MRTLSTILFLFSILNQIYTLQNFNSSDCNSKYGCFFNPKGCSEKNCDFIAKWRDLDDHIEFMISSKFDKIKNNWFAIGFSHDAKMGNDSVVACQYNSNKDSQVVGYYNNDQSPEIIDSKNPSNGLSDIKITNHENHLICSFKRIKRNDKLKNFFDLNQPYYVLMAKGDLEDGSLTYHEKKVASQAKIDFSKAIEVKSVADTTYLVKIHAILMVIAWSFMSTIGILFARYYKYIFPTVKIGGVQFWFTIHRPFMASVCIISLLSFLAILFFKNWEWTSTSTKINFIHSIIGIVTISLAIIQPIMALFRPDKDAPNRPLFNWAHRSVGLIAYFSSTVAVILGVLMFARSYHWVGLLVWIVWLIILITALEIIDYRIMFTDKVQNFENAEMEIQKEKQEKSSVKSYLMLVHLVLSILWTLSVILAILELF